MHKNNSREQNLRLNHVFIIAEKQIVLVRVKWIRVNEPIIRYSTVWIRGSV